MKKILIALFLVIGFLSCSQENNGSKGQTITLPELCTTLNTEFITKVKELEMCKDDGCGIAEHETWFNANNYCNTKYSKIATPETGSYRSCISYLLKITSDCEDGSCTKATVTKEELMSYMNKELEDLNATCKNSFETNPFERCELDHQAYLEVWKVQCNPTEEKIQEYLTNTAGRCTTLAENKECKENVSQGAGFGPILGGCENFETFYSSWLSDIINDTDEYTCFNE